MADAIKSKKPAVSRKAAAPETDKQTKPLEKKISPAHNTTEPYGKSSKDAGRKSRA